MRNFEGQDDNPPERTLTVFNYGEEIDDNGSRSKTRITIAPHNVDFLVASEESYDVVDGVELRKANVIFTSGQNLELYITFLDLVSIERAIGTYFLP